MFELKNITVQVIGYEKDPEKCLRKLKGEKWPIAILLFGADGTLKESVKRSAEENLATIIGKTVRINTNDTDDALNKLKETFEKKESALIVMGSLVSRDQTFREKVTGKLRDIGAATVVGLAVRTLPQARRTETVDEEMNFEMQFFPPSKGKMDKLYSYTAQI